LLGLAAWIASALHQNAALCYPAEQVEPQQANRGRTRSQPRLAMDESPPCFRLMM
jgi:hypothetical protein